MDKTSHEQRLLKKAEANKDDAKDASIEDLVSPENLPPMKTVVVIDKAHWLCPFCQREQVNRFRVCGQSRATDGCGAVRSQYGRTDFAYKIGRGKKADYETLIAMRKAYAENADK